MPYRLLSALLGCLFILITVTAQAGMKEFCAKRWQDNKSMQQYCLDIQEQSTERLAKLLDILDDTHARMRATGGNPIMDIAHQCSRQHHLKVFDAYHNQLVEACLVQYLDHLQPVQPVLQQHAQLDEF